MTVTPPPTPDRSLARSLNRTMYQVSKNWLKIAIVFFGVYSTLPLLTPVLMQLGLQGPARALYTLYSPFCHQFAFRSLFLFGDQAAYPRTAAQTDLTPFEPYAIADPAFQQAYAFWFERYVGTPPTAPATEADLYVFSPWLQFAARDFVGNEQMGYKTALCARDVGIYLAMFAGALIYSIPVVRRRLRPVPLLLYVVLGLAPIGIDGFSQLLGYPPFNLWPPRETTPYFRVLTGVIFGFMTAWLAYPNFESAMRDTAAQIRYKFAQAGIPLERP
ncbi:MAG: DUF2085 domain-containing protein [bacterium]|nr:DUF2085 domain-containing protein [bacterium]